MDQLQSFFMWCTVINSAILLWWWLAFAWMHDWVFKMHTRWYDLTKEKFDAIQYLVIGLLKIAIIVFNLVPYLALLIILS